VQFTIGLMLLGVAWIELKFVAWIIQIVPNMLRRSDKVAYQKRVYKCFHNVDVCVNGQYLYYK